MNTKVTFPELVDAVASATNTSKRVSEIFLKELFALVGDTLIAGENVKIKHLGTFKLIQVEARKSVNVNTGEEIEIPSHNKVGFIPDKELAEAFNQPFSGFETVILNDDIPEEEIERLSSTSGIDVIINQESDDDSIIGENIQETTSEFVESVNESNEDDIDDVSGENTNQNDEISVNEYTEDEDNQTDQSQINETVPDELIDNIIEEPEKESGSAYNDEDQYKEREEFYGDRIEHKCTFRRGFLWGFVSALIVSLGTFICVSIVVGFPLSYYDKPEKNETDTVKTENNIIKPAEVLTKSLNDTVNNTYKPETEVKRDTISKTRFLTTMAREYYGNYNFWVYIYEENRNIIDNPNKIKPGTVMVIPPAGKYGIDKDDPQSLQTAKQKAFEIFKRYE